MRSNIALVFFNPRLRGNEDNLMRVRSAIGVLSALAAMMLLRGRSGRLCGVMMLNGSVRRCYRLRGALSGASRGKQYTNQKHPDHAGEQAAPAEGVL